MGLSLSAFWVLFVLILKMSPKTVLTNGPIKKIWLKNAMEKFSTKFGAIQKQPLCRAF